MSESQLPRETTNSVSSISGAGVSDFVEIDELEFELKPLSRYTLSDWQELERKLLLRERGNGEQESIGRRSAYGSTEGGS
jgi:hypothetical protein